MTTASPVRPPASRPGNSKTSPLGKAGQRLHLADLLPCLAEDGLISSEDAQRMGQYARLSNADVHPLVNLAQRGLTTPGEGGKSLDVEALTQWLASRVEMPYVHIDPLKVELGKISEVMSSQYATRWRILPLEVRAGEVIVATAEPFVTEWVDELAGLMRRDIRTVVANPVDISRYIVEFFSLAKSVRDAQKLNTANPAQNLEQLVEMGRSGKNLDANDQQVVTIVDWLWQYAFDQRASDIHLEPRRESGVIRFRIDGVLHNVYRLPPSVLAAMTSRIKLLGRMDIVEKRRPLDGRIKTRTADGKEIELRLSTLPTAFGEKMVMRIFDPEVLVRSFHDLGFAEEELKTWREMTGRPNGIILVTGPTGSGKTTTLYTTLKQLATEEVNVCTVEDPIEMVEPSFNQMQVQASIDLDFAQGIRALMRQDPDIIMVGEIRDLETANMAIQAALTGHLVLSTLHTNDAASAITRLLDIGVPAYLLNATVIGVMAQRLVRTLCPHCKESTTLQGESYEEHHTHHSQWKQLIRPFKAPLPKRIYHPVGCLECRMTGYKGRTGLYELLVLSDELRELIDSTPDLRKIRSKAMQGGLKPLRLSGAQKIAQGLTTFEEVLKSAPLIGDY